MAGRSLNRRDYQSAIPQLEKQMGSLSKYIKVTEDGLNVKVEDLYDNVTALDIRADGLDVAVSGKARVFTSEPVPPYSIGDLWVEGESGDIWNCDVPRGEDEEFNEDDWSISSKYTDDTTALQEVANRTTLVRTFMGGTLTCYTGATCGVFTNANGSVDIVSLSWSGNTPTVTGTLARYGRSGISFDNTVPFTIGDVNNSFIRWVNAGTDEDPEWKIQIAADTIEMGGESVLTELDQLTVESIEYAYQLSSSGTTVPSGTWSSSPVAPTTTQYAWTRTTTTYSDGSTAVTYTVGGKTGTNGQDGQDGQDGDDITITSTTVRYATSSSGTSAPSSGWQSSVPSVSQGYYLWTRTIVNYSDGNSTTTYSVARQGVDGEDGRDITSQYLFFSSSGTYAGLNVKYTSYNNRVVLNANGLDIYDGNNVKVATFGSTATVGSTSSYNVRTGSTGIDFYSGSTLMGSIESYSETIMQQTLSGLTVGKSEKAILEIIANASHGMCALLADGGGYVCSDGSVTIQIASGDYPFDVVWGSTSMIKTAYSSNTPKYRLQFPHSYSLEVSGSTLKMNSNGTIGASGSRRAIKDNISYDLIEENDPKKLYDLKVAQFKYKASRLGVSEDAPRRYRVGFIAEDVNETYPVASCYMEDGTVSDWDERVVLPAMLALIQEQNERIKALERRIA